MILLARAADGRDGRLRGLLAEAPPGGGRICALVLLVGLYLVAVAWARPDRQLAGGALLVLLVCAWLWLPSIQRGRGAAAAFAVVAAALVAVPAAAAVDPGRALIDYRHWDLLSANGQSFRWDQTYGPLDWPQKGTLLLRGRERARRTTGRRPTSTPSTASAGCAPPGPGREPALGEPLKFHPKGAAPRPDPEWVDRINFAGPRADQRLRDRRRDRSLALRPIEARPTPDAIWPVTSELRPGELLHRAGLRPEAEPARDARGRHRLSGRGGSHYVSFTLSGGADGARSIDPPFWGGPGRASIDDQVRGTPYEGMYALARRLAAGRSALRTRPRTGSSSTCAATTPTARTCPNRTYPLPAFLSRGPRRLLPAVLRRDGADAAHARHSEPGRDRLRSRRARPRAQQLPGRRHGRPRLGRGLLPRRSAG